MPISKTVETRSGPTIEIKLWLAGDAAAIRQACREFCNEVGLCVTVTPTTFVYTGGAEEGACVSLCNYPRFPSTLCELRVKANDLAAYLVDRACQHSVLIVDPETTTWITKRDDNSK